VFFNSKIQNNKVVETISLQTNTPTGLWHKRIKSNFVKSHEKVPLLPHPYLSGAALRDEKSIGWMMMKVAIFS